MIALPNDITFLKAKIQMLWEENEKLKAENYKLRGCLGLNSTNSSKPPSSDGLKKKPITPAIPREKYKKGGQEGHKGNTLKRVTNPDKIIKHKHLPTKSQCCGVKHRGEYPQNVAATTQYGRVDSKIKLFNNNNWIFHISALVIVVAFGYLID
jgi:hypothetical protein